MRSLSKKSRDWCFSDTKKASKWERITFPVLFFTSILCKTSEGVNQCLATCIAFTLWFRVLWSIQVLTNWMQEKSTGFDFSYSFALLEVFSSQMPCDSCTHGLAFHSLRMIVIVHGMTKASLFSSCSSWPKIGLSRFTWFLSFSFTQREPGKSSQSREWVTQEKGRKEGREGKKS